MNHFVIILLTVMASVLTSQDEEDPSTRIYPQILTDIPFIEDASAMSLEELIDKASNHPGLEWIKDEELLTQFGINVTQIHPDIIADAFSTTCQLVRRRGYPCEIHRFQNKDGYIIEMHRIPGSSSSPAKFGKTVAYLQHGLLDSSATWVMMGKNSLGYVLADLGYDVWLGNKRGNRYSREHIRDDPDGRRGDRRRFWNFSWHHIGIVDLPDMIDYITSRTAQHRIHYVGHSQGTTAFFVMCSERPVYNSRIISAHMLAPIAFMGNLRSPFVRSLAFFLNSLDMATSLLGIYEFLPNNEIMSLLGQAACRDEAWFQVVCSNVLFLIGGFNSDQTNNTMLPVIMGHTPAGASTDQMIHYGQGIRTGRFRKYDYGALNIIQHGSFTPPNYKLANVQAPVSLYYSLNDLLSEPVDVDTLWQGLGNPVHKILINDPRFNHFDYVWAIDQRTLVYDRVVDIMRSYERGVSDASDGNLSEVIDEVRSV
ncbi:lipase 3-like [Bradysia coprophila]|uniref:lipase 3-like n=1 Tax=Bradysia coprophila TaxID=38358 RepID=UPI00187DAA6F|nr:lipase 3-like [Bradysia coprophila]